MAPKVRNKISLIIIEVSIWLHVNLELHVARVPIMVQYLLEELLLPVVLGLVFNQWMANMDNLLIIILPPRL
jgi:hypothetical protein